MRKFLIIGIVICVLLPGCELGERLDIQRMGDSPGYFIECYCRPDSMYEMTATRIAPVAEPQVLDYSLEFDVCILADEPVKLYHSLYFRPDNHFVYNYASSKRLDVAKVDSLYLEVTAPGGEAIFSETAIPKQVKIDSVTWHGKEITTYFMSDECEEENYYVLTLSWESEGGNVRTYFLSGFEGREQVKQEYPLSDTVTSVNVSLKRMTEAGYRYQYSLFEAQNAGTESLFAPVELLGNICGAMGIFTCYTEDRARVLKSED